MISFSANSKIIDSKWEVESDKLLINRQNLILTMSLQSFFTKYSNKSFLKSFKAVFTKERITDLNDPSSDIDIVSNNWDDNSFQISTEIGQFEGNTNNSISLAFGVAKKSPILQDILKNDLYSYLFEEERRLKPEEKSSFELIYERSYKFEKYSWEYSFRSSAFNERYKNKVKQNPLMGNALNIPQNIGRVSKSGIDVSLELQPASGSIRFLSTISYFGSNDYSKFQLLPISFIKNQISLTNKYFDLSLMTIMTGKRVFTFINDVNVIEQQKIKEHVNHCVRLSKSINYKIFNLVISLIGENLENNVIQMGNIVTNEKKYSIDISSNIM